MNRLTSRQQKAGLGIIEDSRWLYLVINQNKRICILPKYCTPEVIKNYAEKYLNEIDWQG